MKVLSVRQPWANLIVRGIKDIENRSRRTTYRGRILIHAPIKEDHSGFNRFKEQKESIICTPLKRWSQTVGKELTSAIIGSVDITDCVRLHPSPWAFPDCWLWVLKNAILFETPILGIKGQLGLWEFDYKE